MSLPTSETIPEDPSYLPPARKRRERRAVAPILGAAPDERLRRLNALAEETTPSAGFFLYAFLFGLWIGVCLPFGQPVLIIFGLLLVPFSGPLLGISLASVAGSTRFFFYSLGARLVGAFLVMGGGALAGLALGLIPGAPQLAELARNVGSFNVITALGLLLTTAIASVRAIRNNHPSGRAADLALFLIYLPMAACGWELTSGATNLCMPALLAFAVYAAGAVLMSGIVMAIMGLRPGSVFGYSLGAALAILCLFIMAAAGSGLAALKPVLAQIPSKAASVFQTASTRTATPTPKTSPATLATQSVTPRRNPTNTLVPTRTPSETITPAPTPVWAMINARSMNGAYIREEPKYDGKIVTSILNGTLIEVLPDSITDGGILWAHVRTHAGVEGWIVQSLLVTATPSPGW
jgi:hypothetical protein